MQESDPDLRPNCLLTRWPIVILSERDLSLEEKNILLMIQSTLADHGYACTIEDVNHLKPNRCHVFCPETLWNNFKQRHLSFENWQSLTRIQTQQISSSFHRDFILNHAISLAERDFIQSL